MGQKESDKLTHRTHEQRRKASLSFAGQKNNAPTKEYVTSEMLKSEVKK